MALLDEETKRLLEAEGLPTGANAEIAVWPADVRAGLRRHGHEFHRNRDDHPRSRPVGEQVALRFCSLFATPQSPRASPQAATLYLATHPTTRLARNLIQQ